VTTLPFTNFTKGELAPELQARIDTSQYQAGARKVTNFIIQRYGGLSFRPGFRLVSEVDNLDKNIRYFPFQYNIEQSYVMALEDQRFHLMAKGGMVIEQNIQITAITKEAQAVVTAAYHGYEVGDRIYLAGVTGMDEINGRQAEVVEVLGTNQFRIDLDTTGFGTFISSTGDVRSAPPEPPPPPPAPPPVPPTLPEPPPTTEYGGSGGSAGSLPGWSTDGVVRPDIV
jgi:hypothetical protein